MNKREGNVVSLSELRLPKLRDEIEALRERLQDVTEIFIENDRSFRIVAEIALSLQEAHSSADLDAAVGIKMVEESADHARFYLENFANQPSSAKFIHDVATLDEKIRARLDQLDGTTCEVCRPETYKALLHVDIEDVASIAMIPANFHTVRGVLVIGAGDPDFFAREVGTIYLDFLGASLARSAYRLFGS